MLLHLRQHVPSPTTRPETTCTLLQASDETSSLYAQVEYHTEIQHTSALQDANPEWHESFLFDGAFESPLSRHWTFDLVLT